MEWIMARTDVISPFTAYSNISTVLSSRYVNKSLFDALCELSVTWGGQLDCNNYQVRMLSSLGEDNGVNLKIWQKY